MLASGLWLDSLYAGCECNFMGARCKRQRLRHNIPEVSQWPVHGMPSHVHDPAEWDPMLVDGSRDYPSKEEAEYTACLAFVSLWAVQWGLR